MVRRPLLLTLVGLALVTTPLVTDSLGLDDPTYEYRATPLGENGSLDTDDAVAIDDEDLPCLGSLRWECGLYDDLLDRNVVRVRYSTGDPFYGTRYVATSSGFVAVTLDERVNATAFTLAREPATDERVLDAAATPISEDRYPALVAATRDGTATTPVRHRWLRDDNVVDFVGEHYAVQRTRTDPASVSPLVETVLDVLGLLSGVVCLVAGARRP